MAYYSLDTTIYDNPISWNMTNDLIFKYVFGQGNQESKAALIDLLNAVLLPSGHKLIVDIQHLNPFNHQLKQTIAIHFVDHKIFDGSSAAHSIHHIYDNHHNLVTDLFEIHYVQMPLIGDIMKEEKALFDWITVMRDITNPSKRVNIEQIVTNKDVMKMAIHQYKKVTSDDLVRERLEAQKKFELDHESILSYETMMAKKDAKEELLNNMHQNGLSITDICKFTNLTEDEVQDLLT